MGGSCAQRGWSGTLLAGIKPKRTDGLEHKGCQGTRLLSQLSQQSLDFLLARAEHQLGQTQGVCPLTLPGHKTPT